MKYLTLTTFLLLCCQWSNAQDFFWTNVQPSSISETGKQDLYPDAFRTYQLDTNSLLQLLDRVPKELETPLAESESLLRLPLPDGSEMVFRVVQYDMMEAGLQAKYPSIITVRGISIDDPKFTLRADWTHKGFRASFASANGRVFIDPIYRRNRVGYMVYYKKDYPTASTPFTCHTHGEKASIRSTDSESTTRIVGDCQFRSYRLAVATTGEYSNFHGANSAADASVVLAEVITAINRVNEIYERDVSVRLVLTANTDAVFYYNGNTDPYTNSNGSTMLGQNQANLDATIGSGSYDIGHVFSTGGGGVARLRSPCNSTAKAQGVTGLPSPINDPFYIDYVAHEIGHQFGGNHTQNNNCNRRFPASMEPGSASTIMGYAGICNPNVQFGSDAYFHGYSILEMANFVTNSGSGGSCATIISTTNSPPGATDPGDHFIPPATPFRLGTTGNDGNNPSNSLTYCWEQWDPEAAEVMPPVGTNVQGPLFRSLNPTSESTRYFPALVDVLDGTSSQWEVLPNVDRNMEFRVSVRDNNSSYGCIGDENVSIGVSTSGGPFAVTSQSGATSWLEGQYVLVEWNKGATDIAPINSPNVNVYLARNGQDFSTLLASNIPNSGKAYVLLPQGTSSNARIMVEGAGNVFYSVNTGSITIGSSGPDYALGAPTAIITSCPNQSVTYTIETSSFGGYTNSISLGSANVPSGLSLGFGSTTLSPGGSTTLTVAGLQNISTGFYTFNVTATSASGTKDIILFLNRLDGPAAILTSSPVDNNTEESVAPSFDWQDEPSSSNYEIQLASDPSFNNIIATTVTINSNWAVDLELAPLTTYYWRVSGIGDCGIGPWSSINSFTTVPCIEFNSSDVPIVISSSGAPTYISELNIGASGTLKDVNIINLEGDHTWVSDLVFTLTSPDGTSRGVFGAICGSLDDFDLAFNSQSNNAYSSIPCPPTDGNIYQPAQSFNNFNDESINGNWILTIQDRFNQDGGQVSSWGLRLCVENYVAALPVELLNFSVQAQEDALLLNWATASEIDNKGFWIERKLASEAAFTPIAWVDGQGTTELKQSYQYVDETAPRGQTIYYQLRQVDFDGAFDFSPVRQGKLSLGAKEILVYPNPAYSELTIERSEDALSSTALLYDTKGRLLLQQPLTSPNSQLDIIHLPSGIYWLSIRESERIFMQKVIKL
ncbi:MAG: reprolysin-like metallopeptidase [Bacteroidota bacterium]